MLMGTLAGVEMGLDLARIPHKSGGVLAAMDVLKAKSESETKDQVVEVARVAVA
jgi:alanine-glyoxylate transaminase/serine-glyoxylate transaminase/serine-pyruvate transaminase